jgi:predicted transglutaminase-like cysteine proteinase
MNRFLAGACAVLLLTMACSNAPAGSPARSPAGGATNAPGTTDVVGSAQEQLCDEQSPTGLAMVADEVAAVDENTDVTQVNASVNAVLTNVSQIQGDDASEPLRAAAASAGQAFQQAISDPTTRTQAATALAQALNDLEAALCG